MNKYRLGLVTRSMVLDVDQTGFPCLTAMEAAMGFVMLEGYVVDVLRGKKVIVNFEPSNINGRPSVKVHPIANDLDDFELLALKLAGREWRTKDIHCG